MLLHEIAIEPNAKVTWTWMSFQEFATLLNQSLDVDAWHLFVLCPEYTDCA
ncbi:MAG: hypothetical protein ABGZ23_09065 [Fuerstiella sp.]